MFSRVFYLEVKELGRHRLEKDHSGFQLCPRVWVTLGCPFPHRASVSLMGVSWGKPEEAGPGWEQDRPLRPAKTSRACTGDAQGSSPGAGVVAPAAGGLAAAASAPAAARRRGRSRAGVSPPPPSGCSGGAGGGARAEPEPSRCPSPARYRGRRWAGRPCHCSRRLRVRAGGASSAGKGEAPALLQSFGEVLSPHIPGLRLRELPLGFFRAALHAVLPVDPRRSSCPHSRRPWLGRRLAWDLQRLTLYLGSVCLKFPRSARCS